MSVHAREERLQDLLVLKALEALDPCDRDELDALLASGGGADTDAFDRSASAVHLSLLPNELEPVPFGLRERLSRDAAAFFETREVSVERLPSPPPPLAAPAAMPATASSLTTYLGWLAAAAMIVLWVALGRDTYAPVDLDLERASLIAEPHSVLVAWSATEDEGALGAQGDVVWSDAEQRGFMRFDGLRANDPLAEQYQLWIFDAERPDAHPVDGGVFDVGPSGEVVVPIDPKLGVSEATLFAVTLEPPGGVVVSTRERLLLTAAVP